MKWSFLPFLVCTFHKEPIKLTGFDPLYHKNYFEILLSCNKYMLAKIEIYYTKSICNKCFTPPPPVVYVVSLILYLMYSSTLIRLITFFANVFCNFFFVLLILICHCYSRFRFQF